jgi:hypothetical protein
MTRTRAEEYRRKAQECLDLAPKISLERERAVILDIHGPGCGSLNNKKRSSPH